jgi:hypothetical protein
MAIPVVSLNPIFRAACSPSASLAEALKIPEKIPYPGHSHLTTPEGRIF